VERERRVSETVGGKQWQQSCGRGQGSGCHCLKVLDAAYTSVQTRSPIGGSHTVFYFSCFSKTGSTLKNKNGCLILLQKFLIFASNLLGYYEQFCQLCRHPVPNINRAKNPRPDLTFESLMNFKRDLNLPSLTSGCPSSAATPPPPGHPAPPNSVMRSSENLEEML
jgi:hypothetical protein